MTRNSESEYVRLHAVEARISTPLLHDPERETDGLDAAALLTAGLEPSATSGPPPLASDLAERLLDVDLDPTVGRGLAVAATAAGAALILSGDIRAALGSGLAIVIFVATWVLGGRFTFSIGQGVVGYRSDMGWPDGVQEDDDLRWKWRSHKADADDKADDEERARASPRN